MPWLSRASRPVTAGRLNLSVMTTAYLIFGLSLLFQPRRWSATPAYHVLLQIFAAQAWGGLFLASGVALGAAVWQFERRRWAVITALTFAAALTAGWMLAFIARYLSSPDTTPETWVSWAVFGFLLLQVGASLDRPRPPQRDPPEIGAYRQAVDDALDAAAAARRAAVNTALDTEAGMLRGTVSAACAAYGEALWAVIPAGAMPGGVPAWQALDEARNALLRAEEAFERATGTPARTPPPPP